MQDFISGNGTDSATYIISELNRRLKLFELKLQQKSHTLPVELRFINIPESSACTQTGGCCDSSIFLQSMSLIFP